MQLDNEHMISQTLATTIEEVETMYWMTESAIYKGDIKQAKIVFEFLLYLAKYKPAFIQKGLQKPYRARLQQISHELYEKSVPKKETSIVIRPAVKPQKIPFKKEAELREYLADHPKILSKAIGQDIKVTGTEIETDDDYRCDIVAENGKYLYPIELKIVKGTHQVVSQCTKYCYYFYRKLRYDRFKTIQGVVIANGFDDWSVNELRRQGHWVYNIIPVSDVDITLKAL